MINGRVMSDIEQHREGSPLKDLRIKLGLSQQAFATSLGVSMGAVSRWENGHRSMSLTLPQMASLIKLLREVDWDIDDFLDRAKAFELACTK